MSDLLSMLDAKESTLELHENWGQFYITNLPECRKSTELEYKSLAIYFDGDTHNLTFMKQLQFQVAQAIQWLESRQAERRPTTCVPQRQPNGGAAKAPSVPGAAHDKAGWVEEKENR